MQIRLLKNVFITLSIVKISIGSLYAESYGGYYNQVDRYDLSTKQYNQQYSRPEYTRMEPDNRYNNPQQQYQERYDRPNYARIKQDDIRYKQNEHYKDYKYDVHKSLNQTVLELANKLLANSRINTQYIDELAITSFVDLHQLNKTTHFGRTLSETMFDELFVRGFGVTEFRGQNTLSINAAGEYFISRDLNNIRHTVPNKYILVGTYTTFEDSVLVNARILNNTTGQVVSSARAYYYSTDCKLFENCAKPRKINIISDNSPMQDCRTGICEKTKLMGQKNTINISRCDTAVDHNANTIYNNTNRQNKTLSLIN